jgi:hypothetical protein
LPISSRSLRATACNSRCSLVLTYTRARARACERTGGAGANLVELKRWSGVAGKLFERVDLSM